MTVNEERGKSWSDMVDNAEEVMDEGYNAMALLEQLDKDIPHCYGEIRVRVDNAEEVMDEGYNAMALLEQLDKDIPHCYGEIRVRVDNAMALLEQLDKDIPHCYGEIRVRVALLIDRQRLELEDETPREDDRRSTSIF